MPTVRRARATDAPIIVEYNYRLAQETEAKTLDRATLTAGVAAGLADPAKALYFVAEEDGAVIGQVMVTYEWSDWRNGCIWWIQSVYVRADWRGKGVFRSLYEHVHRMAIAAGNVVALRLYVEEENHAAQQTYQKLGMSRPGYFVLERCPL
jgi:ribosomal protein S18 acetylase RimI-like enzyme